MNNNSIYAFDKFQLDAGRLMLYRAGDPIKLPPKAVETLVVLIRNHGEILSKDDLMSAVWKGVVVEESNLTQYLYLLRKELGTRADGKPYIETLRKRGYRFVADDVKPLAAEKPRSAAGAPGRRRYASAAVLAVIVMAVSAVYWMRSDQAVPLRGAQIDVVRLTNGIEVNDAVVSPDGSLFVYNELDGSRSRIWLQNVGQSSRREIVPWADRRHGAKTFSPDGEFVYFLSFDDDEQSSLFRVPVAGGDAERVLTDIDSPIAFSPDGSEYAFVRRSPASRTSEIVVRQTDGVAPERTVLRSADSWISAYVAWSPDGRSIAFSAQGHFEPSVWVYIGQVDLRSGKTAKLWDEGLENCYRLEWTPDGSGLYAIATRAGDSYTIRRDQLYFWSLSAAEPQRMTYEGSRLQPSSLSVTRSGSVLIVPFNRSSQIWAMSPNGDSRTAVQLTTGLADGRAGIAPLDDGRIAYIARGGENLNIFTMKVDGSEQHPISTEPQFVEELRASGDGRFLFFSAPNGQHNDLFRMKTDGSELTQMTFARHVIDSGPSHDGKWIAFETTETAAGVHAVTLWKMSTDGGPAVKLKADGCGRPHYSPDDRFISCVDRDDNISVLSAEDGKVLKTFEPLPRATLSFGARWTPDGSSLAYIVTEKDVSNIWVQPVGGGSARRLTDFPVASIYHFAFSRNGDGLYLARGTQIRDALLISTAK